MLQTKKNPSLQCRLGYLFSEKLISIRNTYREDPLPQPSSG